MAGKIKDMINISINNYCIDRLPVKKNLIFHIFPWSVLGTEVLLVLEAAE